MSHHSQYSRVSSPFRAQSPYVPPSPDVMASASDQGTRLICPYKTASILQSNPPFYDQNNTAIPYLRRSRSSTSSAEGSPHISCQPHESRPPLRFYVDDAIHELLNHKQKYSSRSKGAGGFGLIAGLFACLNPAKNGSSTCAEARRSLSASKRVSELLEISKKQQSELAEKQDTIHMLEWQLEQMQAMALMDPDKLERPVCRSTAGVVQQLYRLAALQDCTDRLRDGRAYLNDLKAQTDEKLDRSEHGLSFHGKIKQKEINSEHLRMKPKPEKTIKQPNMEDGNVVKWIKADENYSHPLHDCKLKTEKTEKKQPVINASEEDPTLGYSPVKEQYTRQHHRLECEQDATDMESTMATLLLFEMATMRARFSVRSFTKALIKQMEASGYSVIRTLSELEPDVAFMKKEHVAYTLESRINRAFFHGFENDSFDGSGVTEILDPVARCAARLDEFQRMKLVEVGDAVDASHPSFDPGFRRFCQRKTKELWSQFSWHVTFKSVQEREVFTASFLDAAKSVWLLHKLAFSVNPHVLILRVGKGLEIDPLYVDAVPNLRGTDAPPLCRICSKSKVEFLIMPGFQAMGKVVKCQVYQHVQCLVD